MKKNAAEQKLFDSTRAILVGFGFSFHQGGENDAPELFGKHWYAWCGPNGTWDVEVGLTCDSEEESIANAMEEMADWFARRLVDAGEMPLPEVTQ